MAAQIMCWLSTSVPSQSKTMSFRTHSRELPDRPFVEARQLCHFGMSRAIAACASHNPVALVQRYGFRNASASRLP
jgi:hypothetical protein